MVDLFDIAPEWDRWIDDNIIITAADKMESITAGEAIYAELVDKKLAEIALERKSLLDLLSECYLRFKQYDMDVDCYPPDDHVVFINKIKTALGID